MIAGLSDSSRFLPLTKSAYHHEKGLAHALRFDRTFTDLYYRSAGWSSLVARWAHNPKVGGSNPPPATKQLLNPKPFLSQRKGFFIGLARICTQNALLGGRCEQLVQLLHQPAIIFAHQVGIAHSGLRIDMAKPRLPHLHRSV